MLKENCFISQIDLSYNNIGSPCAHALADMLSFNNTVTHCNFSGQYYIALCCNITYNNIGNNFDDKAVEPLGEIIKVFATCMTDPAAVLYIDYSTCYKFQSQP